MMGSVAVPPVRERTRHAADAPYPLPDDEGDRRRLDAAHYALKEYLKGNFVAPIQNPSSILDLGTGSGIWAIEMAEQFPKAQVLGVDISPVRKQSLPPNCSFDIVNLAKEWPFPPSSFDVIHSRFCLVHVPNPKAVVQAAIRSLKPGGYLLVEEGTQGLFEDGGVKDGIRRFYEVFANVMKTKDVDNSIGPKLQRWLEDSGVFDVVEHRLLTPPMMPYTNGLPLQHKFLNDAEGCGTTDETLNRCGEVLKNFLILGYSSMQPSLEAGGMTKEVLEGFIRDVNDPTRKACGHLNWVVGRKRL